MKMSKKIKTVNDLKGIKNNFVIINGKRDKQLKNECEEQVFDTSIESLDNYFLYNLFSYLGLKEKLGIERVSKRWQSIITDMVSKQTGIGTTWSTDEDYNCLEANREHSVTCGDIRDAIPMTNGWHYDLSSEKALKNLSYISEKCPNIRCLHISHSIIDWQTFEKLLIIFKNFECLHLKSNLLKTSLPESGEKRDDVEWSAIGKVLGKRIKHLSIDPHYEFRMNESHMKNFLKHFEALEEFRVGSHFEREVIGKFIAVLPSKCRVFYSFGREFSIDALKSLAKNNGQYMTHLSFFSSALRSTESLQIVGEKFRNLVKLKINLSFNEIILSASSPITQLNQLKELSIDLNTFTDSHVDDGLIWCIKDGLPSVNVLEISRACLSGRAFNSINYCLPHLKKLILKAIEVQCNCQSSDLRDRIERYSCIGCRKKCWNSVADLSHLKELQVVQQYHRSEKPKPFHEELSQLLPQFKCLRHLKVIRYDINSSNLIENLNKLMSGSDPKDIFTLFLKSVPMTPRVKAPKVFIYRENFML